MTARFSLILALLAAPLRAQNIRVDAVETAPAAVAPSVVSPVSAASLAVPSLTAAPLGTAPSAAPLAAAMPVAAPADLAPAPAALAPAAPAAVGNPAFGRNTAAASESSKAIHDAAAKDGVAAPSDAGWGLFDQGAGDRPLSEIVQENAGRPLRHGVFIQQEHEGSLISPDSRDSSGNVFKYYRPIELRPDLVSQTESTIRAEKGFWGFLDKSFYYARRAVEIRDRGTPEAAWRAWSTWAKADYLGRLEAAVTAERGPQAAWNGKVSLIMEKTHNAPDFVARNPHMEAPPAAYRNTSGAKFLQPEIVSAKDNPARSINEALGRASGVIADTGHAGVQFHVFVKADQRVLLAQADRLSGALQLVNDVMFAKSIPEARSNLALPFLMPWHRGRSDRVRALLESGAAAAHDPEAEDLDSEKYAFVGLRYWGQEDGKTVISFELRGATPQFKPAANGGARELSTPELPKRDFAPSRSYLTFLSLYAEALARGEAPPVPASSVAMDAAAAETYLKSAAKEMGVPDGGFDGLDALSRRVTRLPRASQGQMFPFAASAPDSRELRLLAKKLVEIGASAKAMEISKGANADYSHLSYLLWEAYADWAKSYGARQNARLAALTRLLAR